MFAAIPAAGGIIILSISGWLRQRRSGFQKKVAERREFLSPASIHETSDRRAVSGEGKR